VSRWENGEVLPSSNSVFAVADALDFPALFFSEESLEDLADEAVSFRAPTKVSARLKGAAIAAGAIGVSIGRWIEARFHVPVTDIPTLVGYDPEVAANALRRSWGLGSLPIKNLLHTMESHGVRVFSLPRDIRDIDAFGFYMQGRPYVYVNTTKSGERQRFDLAHELGHLVLHCEESAVQGRERELEAHRFAAALLMPATDVLAQPLAGASVPTILEAKRRWGVAAMALTHRLHQLELISDWTYRDNCVALAKSGFRSGEPAYGLTAETSQVLRKSLGSLRRSGLGIKDIAGDLHLDEQELTQHIFGLAVIPLPAEPTLALSPGKQVQLTIVR